jgi:Ala-tRNA(Pro) deacylase
MRCRERLETFLQERGVAFEVQRHPIAYTAQRVAASEHLPGELLAKVVMADAGGRMTMFVIPAPDHLDVDKARHVLGTEVRILREREFTAAFPDCDPGTMPPFGNLYGVPVYSDNVLGRNRTIVFQAGTHTETMSIAYEDFARLVEPVIGDFVGRREGAVA